jgi:glycosyltransferase involved in cell wall biosynthesis
MRGSAHIAVQDRLLAEEERRNGRPIDRPSPWMLERETQEYALADGVVVLSSFAKQTFEAQGFPPERLHVLPLGVDSEAFQIPPALVAARNDRIRRGDPLRALYAGALSFRKGLRDLLSTAALTTDIPCEFRLAGGQMPETAQAMATAGPNVIRLGHVPQAMLPAQYWDADLFIFPTIEDGFGVVLPQAQAAGLPLIATDHCAAPDLVENGRNGWVFPIRAPERLAAQLRWCHEHRQAFTDIASDVCTRFRPRTWAAVAADFERTASPNLSRTREVSCS